MNTKLFLQVLLALGCVAAAIGVLGVFTKGTLLFTTQGWWRAAVASWLLVIAVRMVYPAPAK